MVDDTKTKSLAVGIVGAGGIALAHMASLRASDDAHLEVVCDSAPGRAEQAARVEGCRATTSLDELLADPSVDAVMVCTPNSSHEAIGAAVIAAGKHLFMEKPLALTVSGGRRLAAAAEEAGLALGVGHSHRFSEQSLAIRRVIDDGSIGTPTFIRITINGGWIWPGWQAWVLDPELSGGHSLHNGVHLMDLATWWMGEPATAVYSRGQKATSAALPIYDLLLTELSFASGASAICEVSRGERPRASTLFEVLIVGTAGTISRTWDAEGIKAWGEQGLLMWPPAGLIDGMFARELAAFVAATSNPRLSDPPPEAAVRAVEMGVASEASLVSGENVQIGGIR